MIYAKSVNPATIAWTHHDPRDALVRPADEVARPHGRVDGQGEGAAALHVLHPVPTKAGLGKGAGRMRCMEIGVACDA